MGFCEDGIESSGSVQFGQCLDQVIFILRGTAVVSLTECPHYCSGI